MKTYKEVAEVNLWGTIRVTKGFLPYIRRAKGEWWAWEACVSCGIFNSSFGLNMIVLFKMLTGRSLWGKESTLSTQRHWGMIRSIFLLVFYWNKIDSASLEAQKLTLNFNNRKFSKVLLCYIFVKPIRFLCYWYQTNSRIDLCHLSLPFLNFLPANPQELFSNQRNLGRSKPIHLFIPRATSSKTFGCWSSEKQIYQLFISLISLVLFI